MNNNATVSSSDSRASSGDRLNPEQEQAIKHKDGPMMVLAGPGSGKTFVITRRIAHLILAHGVPPEQILVVTFTKAAALEMEERFLKLCERQGVCFGTFHAVFFSILKESLGYDASSILREEDKKRCMREAFGVLEASQQPFEGGKSSVHGPASVSSGEGRNALPQAYEADEASVMDALACISRLKNDGLGPESYDGSRGLLSKEEFLKVYAEYKRILSEERKLDFDDMVLECYRLLSKREALLQSWQDRYRYILVDEFQDINPMQYRLIRMLAEPRRNLFIVGDDDQSIYGFRSADPGIMLGFPKDYPELVQVTLKENYRSRRGIVDAAMHLVEHNSARFAKKLGAARGEAPCLYRMAFSDKAGEAGALCGILKEASHYMDFRDMALLFRTREGARYYAAVLAKEGIPFYLKEQVESLFSGSVGKDLLAILAYAHGDHSRKLLLRFMNKPQRYIRRSLLDGERAELSELALRPELRPQTAEAVRRLQRQLRELSGLPPYPALMYIRKNMGYEAWLKQEAKKNSGDTEAVEELLGGICDSAKDCESYGQWLELIEDCEESLKNSGAAKERNAVQLMTMHGSKGLEYRLVILPDLNEGNVPQRKAAEDKQLEEERRIFYVAMTRARDKLFLLYRKKNEKQRVHPSRFLKEL